MATLYRTVRLRFVIFIISLIFVCCGAYAQAPVAAQCNYDVKMTSKTEGVIEIKVTPSPGWHIYAFDVAKGGPRPMKLDLSASQGIELIGDVSVSKKPSIVYDKSFEMDVTYWSVPVIVSQRFKLISGDGAVVSGFLQYQGCNDETCSPPRKFKFSHIVK